MSRPKNLPFESVGGWAAGNFFAGSDPWNSMPARTVPILPYFVPGDPAAAEEDNYAIGSLWDAVRGLLSGVGQVQVFNWPGQIDCTEVTVGGLIVGTGLTTLALMDAVHSSHGVWYVSVSDNPSYKSVLFKSQDGGKNWVNCPDGANEFYYSGGTTGWVLGTYGTDTVFSFDNTTTARKLVPSTGTWSNSTMPNALSGATVTTEFNGVLIVCDSTGSAYYNGAWNDIHTSLPLAATHTAQSTTLCVFAGGTSLYKSSDGTTWAAGTAPSGTMKGLSWNSTFGVFVAITSSGVYTSPDCASWSSVGTAPGTSTNFLYSAGALLLTIDDSTTNPRLYYSLDSGINWSAVPSMRMPTTNRYTGFGSPRGGSTVYLRRDYSGNQACAFSSTRAYFSLKCGT